METIIAAGGDGTVNEVLNGLADPSKVPILPYPTGTANMLARELNLAWDAATAIQAMERRDITKVDVGIVSGHRFLLALSAGFDARVTKDVGKRRGKRLGYSGYFGPILRALATHRPTELRVTVDDGEPHIGVHVMLLKARRYGGHFVFSDEAGPTSGRFHIRLFCGSDRWSLFRYAFAGLVNRISSLPDVVRLTGRKVTIESTAPVAVQVDGDYFGRTPVTAELIPERAQIVIPKQRLRKR